MNAAAAKQAGITAAVALIAGVAGAKLAAPTLPYAPPPVRAPHVHANRWDRPDADLTLRLVSCGDSREAHAIGDDLAGTVQPGAGASSCTVIFAMPWGAPAHCLVTAGAGHVVDATPTDLIVEGVEGGFSYACAEVGP